MQDDIRLHLERQANILRGANLCAVRLVFVAWHIRFLFLESAILGSPIFIHKCPREGAYVGCTIQFHLLQEIEYFLHQLLVVIDEGGVAKHQPPEGVMIFECQQALLGFCVKCGTQDIILQANH